MQKTCKKCKDSFKLISQEMEFYKKMGLPKPDNCPTCRYERRAALRNDRKFYKYPCAKCGKDMVTTINQDKEMIVYCLDCYAEFRVNVDLTKI